MRLAIADPPYFKRAERWYGPTGKGDARGVGRADEHPEAHLWDEEQAHIDLVARLVRDFDGWVIAATADSRSLALYAKVLPVDVRTMVWHRPNALPSGSRIGGSWEPVYAMVPKERRGHAGGLATSDVFTGAAPRLGFKGAKPEAWTRWVLTVMGYDAATDEIVDIFAGSGAVAAAFDGLMW